MKQASIITKTVRSIPYVIGAAAALSFVVACGKGNGRASVQRVDPRVEQAAIEASIKAAYPDYKRADAKNTDLANRIEGASAFVTVVDPAALKYEIAIDMYVTDASGTVHNVSGKSEIVSTEKMVNVNEDGSRTYQQLTDSSKVTEKTGKKYGLSATCATTDCSRVVVLLQEDPEASKDGDVTKESKIPSESVIVFVRKKSAGDSADESAMQVRWTPLTPAVTTEGKRGGVVAPKLPMASDARKALIKENKAIEETPEEHRSPMTLDK